MSTETNDFNIGRTVMLRGKEVRIAARVSDHYRLENADGKAIGWELVENLSRSLATSAPAPSAAGDIVAEFQAKATGLPTLQERAARALQDLQRIRAGLDPLPMTDAERQSILNRCANAKPVDPASAAAISRTMSRKPTSAATFKGAIGAEVVRLIKRK